MPPLVSHVSALASSLFRFFSWLFLRIIPARWNEILLPTLYLTYLLPALFASTSRASACDETKNDKGDSKGDKHAKPPVPSPPKSLDTFWDVLFSFPSSKRSKLLNFAVNTTILFAVAEFALHPIFDTASHVAFTRVGAIYPDAAKLFVRYPRPDHATDGSEESPHSVRILWRRASDTGERSAAPDVWTDGPIISLTSAHDWANTTKLNDLWPSTEYEYILVDVNKGLIPAISAKPIRFRTFPDSRLPGGSRFRFVVSSCVTPNFPYRPFHGRTIKGFDLLANYLALEKFPAAETVVELPSTDSADFESLNDSSSDPLGLNNIVQLEANSTRVSRGSANSTTRVRSPRTEFLMFLGDFIYADVPVYFGEDKEAYRRLYRRNYQSPSFRKVYEQLPIFHTYDDHEIVDNFAGQANDSLTPFPSASDAFRIYNADVNFDPIEKEQFYYDFRYGDAAFFVMDTRRYRSDVKTEGETTRTMLGDKQLSALHKWLGEANNTATFKFIVSSVPFTSLWTHDAQVDSWAGFALEKATLLDALHAVPNVVLLSGDRHEFAAVEFNSERKDGHRVLEISTSPLSMFYIPLVRTLRLQSENTVQRSAVVEKNADGVDVKVEVEVEIPQERVLKYLPLGNHKWSAIEIDTRDPESPTATLEVWIDGAVSYNMTVKGKPVHIKASTSLGAFVPDGLKGLLDKVGLTPNRWF
ncbi:hypothetical protein HETIRDRAFT_432282 [Heterobasidion irregulare TC 32-1]|uniref:PhoD-like phosphatase metallophosphatase domain-containing protein n=1 Tax=Heterobasidion irregulare (strain TC 32-1) TaxID=747525 RepID=W4KI92_HETIT|nr:uncharacterized protein HETIRDRAFT_432282 [Heterobasidion irregulare TC 32-1]ETW85567.1 hypothetical protein HETIRDRAFT_432282 [Heterobasidion irregulare TC 32-1]